MDLDFEDYVGVLLIFTSIFIFVKLKIHSNYSIFLLIFGFILIGLSQLKYMSVSYGGLKASFTTLINEVKQTNKELRYSNLQYLKKRIRILEIVNVEFDPKKELKKSEYLFDNTDIPKSIECENIVKYYEPYRFIVYDYNDKQAVKMIEVCKIAIKLNPNRLEYSFFLAVAHHKNQEYKITTKIIKRLANKDYAIAQRKLGIMYLYGNLVKKDIYKAKSWIIKSAENGDLASQKILNEKILN